jgi:NADPH-dependent 2,4-dienoyl-CoA reductase/sulfur reductase-like enzyme
VNPTCGRETEFPRVTPALSKKKVMIAGGGPSGMQCAQTAAARGHDVTLYERAPRLGGALHTASALPDKYDMRRYTGWMVRQSEKCGAKIVLNTEVTPELVRKEKPDSLIIAIGSSPADPPIPGIENAALVNDIDAGIVRTGDKAVILGAGFSGSECAIALLREGKDVTLIDMISRETYEAFSMGSQVWLSVQRILRELGAKFIFDAKIMGISASGVKYATADGEGFAECDTVISALGLKPEQEKIDALLLACPESYTIGDCLGMDMTIDNAVFTGFAYAMDI